MVVARSFLFVILLFAQSTARFRRSKRDGDVCTHPSDPENGHFDCLKDARGQYFVCTATCAPGYNFTTRDTSIVKRCNIYANFWEDDVLDLPSCLQTSEMDTCVPPQAPQHGAFRCTTNGTEKACTLECQDGFRLVPRVAVVYRCSQSGTWSPAVSDASGCVKVKVAEKDSTLSRIPRSAQLGSNVHPSITNAATCMAWGQDHYRTFDGRVYNFRGACEYLLARDCDFETFHVHVINDASCNTDIAAGTGSTTCKREMDIYLDTTTHIELRIANTSGDLLLRWNGEVLTVPTSRDGVVFEQVGSYLTVRSSLGFTIKWDGRQSVFVKVSDELKGRTCGLCGNFDENSDNDFENSDGQVVTSVASFANSWKRTALGADTCPDASQRTTCQTGSAQEQDLTHRSEARCALLLSDPAFVPCHAILDPADYLEACKWDCCSHDSSDCSCSTMEAYSRACMDLGVKLDWRRPDRCPITCNGGMEFQECGSVCTRQCGGTSAVCTDRTCIDGCFCPAGTLLNNGKCVAEDQCPCAHGDQDFHNGETVMQDCNTCTCTMGKWVCTNEKCPSTCSVVGDLHYLTFDGTWYNFMGMCSYYLFHSDDISIIIDNIQCGRRESSCMKSVTIEVGDDVIRMDQNHLLVLNEQEVKDLPLVSNGVKAYMVSSLFMEAELPNGMSILWDGRRRVYVTAPPSMVGKTSGLCGTFDGSQQNDFLTLDGDTEINVNAFGNRWKVDSTCRDVPLLPAPYPCDSNAQRTMQAQELCLKLKSDLFASCHSLVDVDAYYDNCVYDICACEANLQDCLCPSFGQYADTCASKGVMVEWRLQVTECMLKCAGGQEYQVCGNPCERTCRNIAEARSSTCSQRCVEGCNCPDGEALDANGECVPVSQCPCMFDGREFPPGYTTLMGSNLCVCSSAQWRCSVLQQGVPIPRNAQSLCPPTTRYTDCVSSCPTTCDSIENPTTCAPDSSHCQAGCACESGFVLDGSRCINVSACPCHHGGQSFYEGDVISMDCNKCTCRNRRWQCESNDCAGVCTAIGDSHYTTFDGRDFQFQGMCDYVLARSRDGSATPFLVSTENIACGTSGVTCSKMVEISVGEPGTSSFYSLRLIRGQPVTASDPGSPFTVETVGQFLRVSTTFGLSLQWDHGTRLYLTLASQHRGQVEGLCGNFNGDQKDDFTTPQGGPPAIKATTFGDSWRMHSYCGLSAEVTDTCAVAPHRKPWAQRKCGVLASDLFSPCHTIEPYEKYFDRCVYDSCACDLGGDCECLCTAIAAYAHVCATKGALIKWRSSDLCPIECEDCQTYNPCVTTCPKKTCLNRLQYSSLLATCQGTSSMCAEGCDLQPCPPGQVYDSLQSPVTCIPEPLCDSTACEINGKLYREGERVYDYPMCNDQCEICNCRNGSIEHISFGYCTRITVTSVSSTTTGETSRTTSSATTPITPITSSIYTFSSTSSMSSTLTPPATSSAGTPTTPQETSPLSSSQTSFSSGISSTATVTSLSSSSPPSGTSTPIATPSLTPSITPKIPLFPTTSSLLVSSESPDTPSITSSATTVVSQSSTVTSASSTATSSTSFTSPLSSSVSSSQMSSTSDVTSSDSHSSSTGSSSLFSTSISVSPPATSHSSPSSSSPTPSSAVPSTTGSVWTPESSSVTAVTSSTVSPRCTDGWTSWMSVSVPTHVNVGDVETVPLLRTRYAFCQDLQIESIQCRAVGDSTNAASGQKFTCSLPDGLVCYHVDQKEGLCLDYEVRFSCNCELVTTTPTAETSTDSNPTSEVTQSTLTTSSLSSGSTNLDTQGSSVPMSSSSETQTHNISVSERILISNWTTPRHSPPSLPTDFPTPVTQSTVSPTTITMKFPTKSIKTPTYAPTTLKMENRRCESPSWSSWFNVDSPDGEGDFETLLEIQKLHAVCDSHAMTYIQCRTAVTHVRYDMTKDSGVVCSNKTGLSCHNSQQANGAQCEDYEVQVYCDCKDTNCGEPLVRMAAENNILKMSASSEKDYTHTAEHGRLESLTNWSPARDDLHPWLQVDFGYPLKVTGVSTKGNPVAPEWTVLYTLEVSHDCKTFQPLLDPTGIPEIFEGNTDSNTKVTHMFRQNEESVQCVKILPVRANLFYALRLEVLGCSEKIETLSETVSTPAPTPATISKHTISTSGEVQTSSPQATPTVSPTPTPETPSRPTVSQETLPDTDSTQTPTPATISKHTISTTGEVQTFSPSVTPTASPTPTPETPSRPIVSQGLSTTEPSSVTTPIPYTCSDGWTSWFSVDTPAVAHEYETEGDGDYELLSELRQRYSFCATPDAIRCRGVKSKTPSHLFASHVTCDLDKGLVCINAHEASGQCEDFEVSFNCDCTTETSTTMKTTVTSTISPPPTITSPPTPGTPWSPVPSCRWTSWMNSYPRTLSSTGDFETFSNLRMSYPFCEHPTGIECRVTFDASQVNLRGKSYKDAGQLGVTCDLNRGLTCLDISQASGDKCLDYEVRVLCLDGCPESTTPLDTGSSSEPSTRGPSTSGESHTTGSEFTTSSDITTNKVTTSNGTSTVQIPRSTGPQLTESSPATDLTPGTGSTISSRFSSTESSTTSVKVTSTVGLPVVTTTASQTSSVTVCNISMGLSDPLIISDAQLQASTCLSSDYCADRARLGLLQENHLGGGWQPSMSNDKQWIEVDFLAPYPVTGITTQGSDKTSYWVTRYIVYTSMDGTNFYPITDEKTPLVSDGNTDSHSPVTHMFSKVTARYVRIRPLEFHERIGLRFDILGCQLPSTATTVFTTSSSEMTETTNSSLTVTLTPTVTPSMPSTAVPPSGSLSTVSQKWTSSLSSFFSIFTGSSTDKLTSSSTPPAESSLFPDTMPQVSISVNSHLPSEPTTTSTVALTTSVPCMYWSPWFSSHTPSEGGEVETFQDMKTMMLVCQEQQVTQIECRATDSKLPYDQVGQVGVTCSREDLSLVCTSSAQQKCLDYEIRVLCDECISEGTTTSLGTTTTQSSKGSGTTTETSSITVSIPNLTPSATPTVTPTTSTITSSPASSASPTATPTLTPTASTVTSSPASSESPTATPTATPTETPTASTVTSSPASSASPTATPTATPTKTPTASTVTSSPASSASPTATPTLTTTASTITSSPASSASPTATPSTSPTLTPTASTITSSPATSASPTATPSTSPTLTPTASTITSSTATPTETPTASTVTQCSKSKWTSWINRDIPETGEGDYENLSKDELSSLCIGGTITKIECYSGDTPAISTGEVVKCSLQDGLICNNVDNVPSRCSDYRVRYFCECDISTTTTIEITTTTAITTFIPCAWSSWMNADKPNQEPADLGDLETIDLLNSTYGLCPLITAVECRVAGTSTPASGDVTCDALNGLRCYNKEQVSGNCYDYEIRVLCWSAGCTGSPPIPIPTTLTTETTTVACESGYQWSACAYSCDETCDYLARLSGACDGPASLGCVPGCRPVSLQPSAPACPAGQRLKDARTCVSTEVCPCMKPDGTPARAFESWTHPNDACSQCSCFNGAVRCINDDSCTILSTTTSTDQTSPTTPTVCGWSQWMNMDTPATGAADIESMARAATLYNTCPTPSAIECREVTTKVTAQATGQALVCSTATGLECHNVDNVGGCKDYEIRVYCLCTATEYTTTDENTTPTVPTTYTPPMCGWTQWMSSNTPDSFGEQETIPELRSHFDFCQIEDITAIECRSKVSHLPSSEQTGVICDTRFSGLICRQMALAPNETCADYEVRFLCEPTDLDWCRSTSTTDLTTKFSTSHVTSEPTSISETTTERRGSSSTLSTVTPTSQDLSTTKKSIEVSSTHLSVTTPGGEVSTTTLAIVTSRGSETTPNGTSLVSSISTTALHSSPGTGSTPTTTVELLSSTKIENYTKSTDGIQSVPTSSVTQSVPTSSVAEQSTPYFKCHEEMGVASGQIRDDMITASSRRDKTHDESKARLGGSGAWLPARDDKYQYIQVDFLEERYISGVTTQGRHDAPSYVTSFRVLYSVDGVNWNVYQESLTQEKIFVGNTDSNTPVTQNFRQPIRARYIRINPLSWSGRIALRFELYGCFEPYPTPTTTVPPVTTSLSTVTEVPTITVSKTPEACILWDDWVDTTHPTSPDFNDVETLEKIKTMSRFCHKPVEIQCRTAGPDHTPWDESGQQVRCFLWEGLTCLGNEQQEGICLNYEVRLGCISNTSKCTPKATPTAAPPLPPPKTSVVPCYQGLDVSACPADCPLGTYCDGLRCVARHKCPCDLQGQFVKAGDVAQSKSCETCQCLNGRLLCGTRTCPPCPEGVAMLNSSSCECQCVRCTDKEFQCSNGHCIPVSLWCDGIIDCVDDELNCLPTPSTPFITPTSGVTTSSAHTITTFDSTSSHASSGTPVTKDNTDKSTTATSTGFTTVVVTAGNVTTPINCDRVTCPPLMEPTLGPGYTTMRVRIATSCCDEYITMCQPSLCPAADVTCTSPLVLSQIPGEQCCPKYICVNTTTSTATSLVPPPITPVPTPPVCLYLHLDHYQAQISKPVVYSPGARWNDGDCKNCTCIYKPDSSVEVVCDNQNCSPCEIGETMVTKDGECCGHCKAVGCVVNGVVYSKGDVIASDRKCYEKTCTLDGSGDAFVVLEAQKECRPLSDLPLCKDDEQTSAYSSDGCCLTCIPKSSVTCSPQAMFTRLQDSVGFLKAVNPSGVECSNQVPLGDLTKCAGSCDSRAIYSDVMHSFKDTCSCCTPTKTFTRSVQLTCNDGSTLDHTYTVARACSCGACSMQ